MPIKPQAVRDPVARPRRQHRQPREDAIRSVSAVLPTVQFYLAGLFALLKRRSPFRPLSTSLQGRFLSQRYYGRRYIHF
jgi:hypothetical protein